MRAVGLITEYNPFHNGHLYHLRESLKVSGCQAAVAVMSGHFLQRGEPALVDKWVRAEMAVRAGVDLVVELPFPFACNSAPHFARGAVQALEALGATDLCFGSESGNLGTLQACSDFLADRGEQLRGRTAEMLRRGVSYPSARARVFAEWEEEGADVAALETPNNILGIEYLRALRSTGSSLIPHTVRRIGAGYHQEEAVEGIASATGIRRSLAAGEGIAPLIPPEVRPTLETALAAGRHLDPESLFRLVTARLLRGPQSLSGLYLIGDGLENRLFSAALQSASWEELAEAAKARQFTRTRIQRVLCHVLNESPAEEMDAFLQSGPLYLRLLACSQKGRAFLAAARKRRTLPLISNFSRVWPTLKRHHGAGSARCRLAERMLQSDLRATRLYTLLMEKWEGNRNRDFYEEVSSRG